MKHLYTSRGMSRVFRGLVLVLAMVLVACGTDSDEPEPTATADVGQEALPTVPPLESTPDTDVSEDEITVLEPEIPATPEASTPEASEDVEEADVLSEDPEASPPSTPSEDDGTLDVATPDDEDVTDLVADDEHTDVDPAATADATADVDDDVAEATPETGSEDATPAPTERALTGDETFTHPGDGTGGSGMPGELDSNVAEDDTPGATPAASPIAQLSISGCDVPDVPGFLGDVNTFELLADVNFRTGPGIDCDPVFEDSLGEGQVVEVLGGPVTQADDGSEWVQIEVNGEPGWITTEFIEPTE